jgi:HEAT repeat protein
MMGNLQRRFSLESAFADLNSDDFGRRAGALGQVMQVAPHDPRTVPALLAFLDREPRTYTRAMAAQSFGFVPTTSADVMAMLFATASEDESLEVRIAAKYALNLIEQRQMSAQ